MTYSLKSMVPSPFLRKEHGEGQLHIPVPVALVLLAPTHSVKQRKELLQGRGDGQLQEASKLLDGDASSFAGAGHGREALQLLSHVVPLQAGGTGEHASPSPLQSACRCLTAAELLLLEFPADFGELDQAGLHGERQLAGRDHQTAVLVRVLRHWNSQGSAQRHKHISSHHLWYSHSRIHLTSSFLNDL